jgi:hypothetical protein
VISAQVPSIPGRLEPDAIGVTQDVVIGTANAAPTVSVGLTLATLAATAAYASGPVTLLCAVPMLIIANAYRRLNLWTPNCGCRPRPPRSCGRSAASPPRACS